jgi:predicted Zn-dependent peptidase
VTQDVFIHTFSYGLTLLVERMPHVRSAAFTFSLRAGCAHDPPDRPGLAGLLADMIVRGAGERDNRALTGALDALGLDRSESAGVAQMYFSGSTLARNLPAALDIYADILRRPHLPAQELEPAKNLALLDIQGLEDEPQAKVMVELRKRHYPDPLGRDHRGTASGVAAVTIDDIRGHYRRCFQPAGLILAVAGDVEAKAIRDRVGTLFADWKADPPPEPPTAQRGLGSAHLNQELDQTQIGFAYPSVPMDDPDYYAARGAVGVLSEGMSSRLFTEVREKYGLCYAIGARHDTLKGRAAVVGYTAGRPDVAQELLDRTLHELKRLADGIEEEELQRVRAGLKSALIMRQESTTARAGILASDWYLLGRVRPNAEIQAAIDGLTPQKVIEHLRRVPPKGFTVVTLGPKPLVVNEE